MTPIHPLNLLERWRTLREQEPGLRTRDAALKLEVSELELLTAELHDPSPEPSVIRLSEAGLPLLKALEAVGPMMALTRNESAVIEKDGHYRNLDFQNEHVGNVLDEHIDLRVFLKHWCHAVAVRLERGGRPALRGIQVFDAAGRAVHKAWLRPTSDEAAFDAVIAQFRAPEQLPVVSVEAPKPGRTMGLPERFDRDDFHRRWMAMEDTHDFFFLLARFHLHRVTALEFAPDDMVTEVDPSSLERVLHGAAARETPIMVFVGSSGCIEIHSGPVRRIVSARGWLNVLDDGFNLHVREADLARAFVVRKPTVDGIVTSLELYDQRGENVCLLFGVRKPGQTEDERWRELLADEAT